MFRTWWQSGGAGSGPGAGEGPGAALGPGTGKAARRAGAAGRPAERRGRWGRRLLPATVGLLWACGGAKAKPANSAVAAGEQRDTRIVHEACEEGESSAERIDVDGDGRADLIRVQAGGSERCRAVDLNFDGTTDVWIYRDPSGQVRRRETDYDRDGRIDEIALYRQGQLFEQQQATTLRGEIDTWHSVERGRVVRTLRDADGDRVIDQWWEYPDPKNQKCARVHSDGDHDGRPDPGSTLELCDQEASAPPAKADPSPNEAPPAVPVELEGQAEVAPVPAVVPPPADKAKEGSR